LGEAQTSSSLAGAPFLDTPAPPENTSSARRAREAGESSTTGISARSRGCRCRLSFLSGTELPSGFCSAAARQDRACATASSLDDGGVGEGAASDGGDDADEWRRRVGSLREVRERRRGVPRGCAERDGRVGRGGRGGLSATLEGGRFRRLFRAIGAGSVGARGR